MIEDVWLEIDQLRYLEADWNGEGARPVRWSAIRLARRLAGAVALDLYDESLGWLRPEVAPTPDGGVGLSWEIGHLLAWITIPPDSQLVTCLLRQGEDAPRCRVVPAIDVPQTILAAVRLRPR